MDDKRKAAIKEASERATMADMRVTALGYMNVPKDYDARIKSRQEYDLAKAEASDARRCLNELIYGTNMTPIQAYQQEIET